MKIAAGKVAAIVFVILTVAAAAPRARGAATAATTTAPATQSSGSASPQPRVAVRDLLAWGTDEAFWCVDVIPLISGKLTVNKSYFRTRGAGDPQWRIIAELEAQVVSLANRDSELLAVLDDGDWKIVAGDGARSGRPLPGGARVVALAGDGDDVWAVGVAPPGQNIVIPAPATTTTTTTASTGPATTAAPAATRPVSPPHAAGLFQLTRGDWTERETLPRSIGRDDLSAVSLALLDRRLMLAVVGRDSAVRIFTYAPGRGWDEGVDVAVAPAGPPRVRLLDLGGRPALWVADGATNAGTLHVAGGVATATTTVAGSVERWQPIKLQPAPSLQKFDRVALSTALGRLRLIASDGRQRLAEQIYNGDGTLAGPAQSAETAPTPLDNKTAQLIQLFVAAVVLMWVMTAVRQRPTSRDAAKRIRALNLAPMGRRVIGGVIDLLPVLVGLYLASPAMHNGGGGASAPTVSDPAAVPPSPYASPAMAYAAAGLAVYLLHTTLLEVLFARSIGKFATGLRVASLDGGRPTVLSLLTRNLLRLVDLALIFPPIFVFFSPLRQRVGDMAAGTIVVHGGPIDPTALLADDRDAAPPPAEP